MPGGGARWWMTPPPRCRSFSSSSSSLASELSFWPFTYLRDGVPRGDFADGLAVCAEEVPLGRLDSANQLGHLQRGHRQHSAAHHGWGGAGHGGEEWRVQSPDNDTQFSLGDPPGPSFLRFCSYPKIWWWVCITLESCQENGLWMSYF